MIREDLHNMQMKLSIDKKTLVLMFIVCTSFARGVCAKVPTTVIPIAPEPVGSGARALGQSAFIAVADDATAASWNPAGLINLERPEASFVGAWKNTTIDLSSADINKSYDGDSWSEGEINFMSYAQPMTLGNTDVVISVNYHQVYDLGLELNWVSPVKSKARSEGAISAYSLASGLSLPSRPEITIGASFNWYGPSLFNDYIRQVKKTSWDDSYWFTTTETLDDFRGHNFTFGLLWDVYEKQENLLTLGFVYNTPFTAEVDQELVEADSYNPPAPAPGSPYRLDIDFPLSLGAGVNYRISDTLSVAFDVEWKDWSEYKYTGTTLTPSDTLAFRLGAEHLTFLEGARESVLAYRGGVFYEPRPVWDDTLPVYGFSAGLGWTVREQFSLDFAYQFRWGEEDIQDFDYDIKEHFFVASLVIYF